MGYVPPSFLETEKPSSSQDWLYTDSVSNQQKKGPGKTYVEKRVLVNAFKAKYGRNPTPEEQNKMFSMRGATQTIIGQMVPMPSSWTEKDGYYIPPSATSAKGFITPEEHQKLGELYRKLEQPYFKPDYGDSKLMNLLESVGVARDKITKAYIKNKIEQIEQPGKFIPDSDSAEDHGYKDSTPITPKSVSVSTPEIKQARYQKSASIPEQARALARNSPTVTNDLGMQVSSDPIIRAQQELLQYSSKLNRPYMEWGEEAMEELKGLLDEESLIADSSPIEYFNFQELKDDFKLQDYGRRRPEITKFQAGPAPEMYQPGRAYQVQAYDDYTPGDAYSRPEFEGNQQFIAGEAPRKPFVTQYYAEPAKPRMRDIDPQSSLVAPEAEYYNPYGGNRPQDVYQAEEFKVENDPGYQLAKSEAMRGIEGSAAARGQLLSGGALKELQDRAAGLASQQTSAAYDRYRDKRDFEAQQEREGYGRGERYEDRLTDASRYRNEDKYRRYSDAWQREIAEKEMGRTLNDDEFRRWLQEDSQEYGKWQDKRNFAYGEYRDDIGDYRDDRNFRYGQHRDEQDDRWRQYTYGTEFDRATNQDRYGRERDAYLTNRDNFRWGEGQNRAANQENYDRARNYWADQTNAYRYGTDLAYNADQAYQNARQAAYNQDYANFMNLQGDRWKQSLGNLALQDQNQMRRYGQLQDIYNIDQDQNTQRYNTLMDIINMGRLANQSALGQQGNYTNFLGNWSVNQQNLKNARKQQKSDNWWNTMNLFTNILG